MYNAYMYGLKDEEGLGQYHDTIIEGEQIYSIIQTIREKHDNIKVEIIDNSSFKEVYFTKMLY